MLAISTANPLPHLLSQHEPTPSLSMLPPQNARLLDPLSPTKKPKLSLKTSDLAPTFHGSVSRQPGASTEATTTPTTLNTFNNTFELAYRPSPVSTLPSPGSHPYPRPGLNTSSPITRTSERPYHLNLPFGVRPILKNSPLPRELPRPSISASPRAAGRRVFFPAVKKVAFRAQLEDEVVTKQYIMRHADLTSSEDESTPSEAEEQSSISNDDEEDGGQKPTIRVDEVSVRGRRKRKSVAVSPSPATEGGRGREERPRSTSARRSKRKRRWQWSLESKSRSQPIIENDEEVEESHTRLQHKGSTSPVRDARRCEQREETPKVDEAEDHQ